MTQHSSAPRSPHHGDNPPHRQLTPGATNPGEHAELYRAPAEERDAPLTDPDARHVMSKRGGGPGATPARAFALAVLFTLTALGGACDDTTAPENEAQPTPNADDTTQTDDAQRKAATAQAGDSLVEDHGNSDETPSDTQGATPDTDPEATPLKGPPPPDAQDCDDPDAAPRVVCALTGDTSARCCLAGCAERVKPLVADAFDLILHSGDAAPQTAQRDDACLQLSLTPNDDTPSDDAPRVIGVSVDPALLPTFQDSPIQLDDAQMRFHQRQWWCPPDLADLCDRQVGGAKEVKLVVLHDDTLLRSERRRSGKLAARLAAQLKVPVEHVDVAHGPRHARLVAWLQNRDVAQRAELPIDDAVQNNGLTIVVRWPAPRVEKHRKGDRHFSRGVVGAAILHAPPQGPAREFLWTDAPLRKLWGDDPHWLDLSAVAAQQTLRVGGPR